MGHTVAGHTEHVLISGASIAGPTLAYWLVHHGFRVTVVERASGPRDGGSPIDVRGAAADVAARMGISAQLRQAHVDTAGLSFVDAAGHERATLDLRSVQSTRAAYELPRADLARILHRATGDDVAYRFNDHITALHEDDDGVDVVFQHGSPDRFDLVIGADGMHSGVRGLTFGDEEPLLRYLGYYAAVIPVDPRLGRPRWGVMYNSPGRMVCIYSPPARSDALLLFRSPQPLRYDRHDQRSQRKLVTEAFAGESWQVPRLLELMAATDDFYFDSISKVELPRWSRGRIALVGDAAHGLPLFGDGSSQAMIGAYLLAGELAAAGGDHRAGFARYEDRHRRSVSAAQKGMRAGTALLIPNTAGGIRRRNQLARLARLLPSAGFTQRWTTRADRQTVPEFLPQSRL